MYYGQISYQRTMQGIAPTRYTIAQIGCFLTAFCNLRSAVGRPVTPLFLNEFFRKNGVYIDADDGIRDDLYWGAITKFDPRIVVTDVSSGKLPPHDFSIVKMRARNTFGTHFCKVHKIVGKNIQIVDSWDGKIKPATAYNGILGFATYKDTAPKVVKPKKSTYTVTGHDSDGLIAAMTRIGLGSAWSQVAKLNNLRPPYTIRKGQILRLP